MTTRRASFALPVLVAALVAAAVALLIVAKRRRIFSVSDAPRPYTSGASGDEGNASDPVDLISAIDLEVGVIDGASDLELVEKDYDCEQCPIQSGKLEVSAAEGRKPRMVHNSYDDGSHCSFDETYYFAVDGGLIHAITLESCWESTAGRASAVKGRREDEQITTERWDETRTYFHEGRAIKSQRRGGAAREELDGTPWEDDVAPVGDTLPRRADTLIAFFDSDDDYTTFFEDRKAP